MAVLYGEVLVLKSDINLGKRLLTICCTEKLLILGLIIRLIPAAFTAHPTDIESWKTAHPEKALNEFSQVKNYNSTYDSSLYRSAAILIFRQSG